jgi:hypothetical protein
MAGYWLTSKDEEGVGSYADAGSEVTRKELGLDDLFAPVFPSVAFMRALLSHPENTPMPAGEREHTRRPRTANCARPTQTAGERR